MPLTAEQRAEINRENAKKSTGPKSDEGKAISRRNATRHGLRAEVLALPDEDPAVVAARSDAWNDYYQPLSPGAQHLVNECVAATLLSDRCNKYHAAALSQQIRNAELVWDTQREDSIEALALRIKTDPAAAVHRLKQTAHGLRWMIAGWERLQAAFNESGCWTAPERDLAIRLQGFRPEPEHLKDCPPAWLTRFFALISLENPADQAIRFLFEHKHLPDLHGRSFRVDWYPDRDVCQRSLRDMVADELERLRHDESVLQSFDEPDRAEAGDRALILQDPASARLFLRYHSEARNSFQRAYGSLIKALERDAAEDAGSSPVAALPNEPTASAPTPTEAAAPAKPRSPNEADSEVIPLATMTSDSPRSTETTPEVPSQPTESHPRPCEQAGIGDEAPGSVRRVA